jgi:hypothetical protein
MHLHIAHPMAKIPLHRIAPRSRKENRMCRATTRIRCIALVGIACIAAVPGTATAQYNCPVAVELDGKKILAGEIRDVSRPPTDRLWELLKTLSFSPAKDAKDLPDPKTHETASLKGELRVKITGAGQVGVKELNLVRNKLNLEAWVIAPADVTRILELRKASGDDKKK